MSLKFICISDTHNKPMQDLPEGNVLIHAGDWSGRGEFWELERFCGFIKEWSEKFDYVVVIAGNHDWIAQKNPEMTKAAIEAAGGIFLQDSACEIEGVKIYGSPWQPAFFNWAFNLPRGQALEEKWAMIPNNTDILITHGPPNQIGDLIRMWQSPNYMENVGCKDLLAAIQKRPSIKAHIFGHIHTGSGIFNEHDKWFINAAILNDEYNRAYVPRVFELVDGKIVAEVSKPKEEPEDEDA